MIKCPKCGEETNAHYIKNHGMCVDCLYDLKVRR